MRIRTFAKRCMKEILRDPLNLGFGLGFPVVLLLLLSSLQANIPVPLFEINTGAISRGYRTSPYPQMEFLKEFHRCGFGVVITSDCHDKHFIDCFYPEAEQLLAQAGFTSKWILTDNGFKEVEL